MRNLKWTIAVAMLLLGAAAVRADETTVRVGWCTPVIDASAGAPFAAATEFGWFAEQGVAVTLVPLAGSTDCVLNVATGQLKTAFAAPEAVAVIASKGTPVQYYYTAFNRNMFGLAVPEASDIKDYQDLKGKRIGVVSMASVGVVIARTALESAGLDPDKDVSIVVSGPPVQSKALLESGQVDALSQWDMIYETIASAGLALRKLKDPGIDGFPSNGFVALKSTIEAEGETLAAVARGYAMGALYTAEYPEAAAELFFKHYPERRSAGVSLEEDVARSLPTLRAAARLRALPEGQEKWGLSDPRKYQGYVDWLARRGALQSEVKGAEITNNALVDAINSFDRETVLNAAK